MGTHTPEPWHLHPKDRYPRTICVLIDGREVQISEANIPRIDVEDAVEMANANAARIVACVNALAGVPDPAAFVKAARELVTAGSIAASRLDSLGCGSKDPHAVAWHLTTKAITAFRAADAPT